MIDYAKMMPILHDGCGQLMQVYRQADGSTKLPMPYPLPLPDVPPRGDGSQNAQMLRIEIAADVGFLNGVCFMSAVILAQKRDGGI